tara:strand:- start:1000 stop:1770 length:771 start_codon:yes stop_codon:yes gene_type:complete
MGFLEKSGLKSAVIISVIFSFSCDEKIKYSEVTSNLILDIKEEYPDNKISTPVLKLSIETEDYYECANYTLVTRGLMKSNSLRVDVVGSFLGYICFDAFGPATKSMELEGSIQKLILSKNGVSDEFIIEITEDMVSIYPLSSIFASFNYSEYYRYPENSFAFLCGTFPEDSVVCTQFEEILLDNLSLVEFTFPVNGKQPYPNAPASYFKYQNPNDLATVGALLKSFYNTNLIGKEGLGLTIIGWNNTRFRNDKQLN